MPGKPTVEDQAKNVMKRMIEEKPAAWEQQGQRATVTVKISRLVRDFITKSTAEDEPIDRTLRRLLKMKIPPGIFPQRTPREMSKNPPETTTIKVTLEVRDRITSKARWNESIDQTLRRLLGLRPDTAQARRS